ncbi:TPA: tail fiber assembly protein [Enterobacter ludwigii]
MKPIFDTNGLATEPGEIRCFYFDPVTFEYTGWSDEYINVGVSMPGHSTDIEPGDGVAGKVAVFTGTNWRLEEDHRGETVWSTADGSAVSVDYIGSVHDGYTSIAPTTPYDKWDGSTWVTDTEAQNAAQMTEVNIQRLALMAEATAMIIPLQDAKDGGYIDDEDIPVLAAWQKYRYALTKVDLSIPAWPQRP